MPEEQTTIVSVNTEEITVIIDNNLPNLSPIVNIINKLISNYDKFDMISNNVIPNSSLYLNLNEIQDLKALNPLTANWQPPEGTSAILVENIDINNLPTQHSQELVED